MTTTLSATPIRDLIMLLGPEQTANLTDPPSPTELQALDAFGAKLAAMTDDQVSEQWGIRSASLIRDLRTVFAD